MDICIVKQCSLFLEFPKIPKLDLAFAISVGSVDAEENLQQIKDTIKAVIDRYGKSDIRYSLILFGSLPSRVVSFTESELLSSELLKKRVDSSSRPSGAALDKALDDARMLFENTARPDAKKVLVVIMDQKQSGDQADSKVKAKELKESSVKVVPVALGKDASAKELTEITSDKDYLVEMGEDENPEKAAEKIMIKVLEGNH